MAILRTRVAVLAVAGLAAVGGACGGGDPGAGAKAKQPTALDKALGMDPAAIQERERKVQEAVRACMQAEGFEYVPVDPSQSNMRVITPFSQDTSEFRRTRGYAVSTTFDDAPAGDEAITDPNQKIRESLSDEQKKAYDAALFGKAAAEHGGAGGFAITIGPGAEGDAETREPPSLEDSGCFGKAQQQVGGGPEQFDKLGPRLQELEQRIEADPRMVKANAAWSTCMAKAGHSFDKPGDIMSYLFQRMQKLTAAGGGEGGVVGLARPGARADAPPVDEAELAKLQQEELSIAHADDECSEKSGRRATAKKVRTELEKRFLEDNPGLGGA